MKAINARLSQLRQQSYYDRLTFKKNRKQIKYLCPKCNKIKVSLAKDYYENKICRVCLPLGQQVTEQEVLLDMARVLLEVGEPLTTEKYKKQGKYSMYLVNGFFKKPWKTIVKDAMDLHKSLNDNSDEKQTVEEKKKEKIVRYKCAKCNKVKMAYAKYNYEGRVCRDCSPSGCRIEVSDILTDVKRVVRELGYQPTIEQYKEYGKYGLSTIYRVCKMSWKEILTSLGYKVLRRVHDAYSFQEIVAEMERVRKELGKIPTYSEYMNLGKISATALRNATRETKWPKILAKIFSLDESTVKLNLKSNKGLINAQLEKIKQIASKLGRSPSLAEASKYGVDVELTRRRLSKNWSEVLEKAGLQADETLTSSENYYIKDEDILSDIIRVAKELGTYPSAVKYEKLGYFLPGTIEYRFNTNWPGVISLAKTAAERNSMEVVRPSERMFIGS
jgi:hypothetical protein